MITNKVVYDGFEYDTYEEAFDEFKLDINYDDTVFETENEAFKYFIDNEIDETSKEAYYDMLDDRVNDNNETPYGEVENEIQI